MDERGDCSQVPCVGDRNALQPLARFIPTRVVSEHGGRLCGPLANQPAPLEIGQDRPRYLGGYVKARGYVVHRPALQWLPVQQQQRLEVRHRVDVLCNELQDIERQVAGFSDVAALLAPI